MDPFENLIKILTIPSPHQNVHKNFGKKTPGSLQVPCYQQRTTGYEILGLGTRGGRWEEGLKQHFSTRMLLASCTGHVFSLQNTEYLGPAPDHSAQKYPQPRLCDNQKKAPTYFQILLHCLRTPGQKGKKEAARKTEQER